MFKKSRLFAALGAAFFVVLASGLGTGDARAADTIVVGVVAKLAAQWPVYVAIEKGMAERANVKLDVVATGGSAKATQQLAAGAINIGEAGVPDHLRAIDQGAPVKIIDYEMAQPPYNLMAAKNIKSIADLKGKKVMVGGSKDVTMIYLEAMVKPAGLKVSDFDLLFAGATGARFAALAAGGADAAILSSPFDFQAQGMGFTDLGQVHKVLPGFPFTSYGVNTDWAKSHRNAVIGFIKAFHQAIDWLYDKKNKNEAVNILVKATDTKPDDVAKTYDLFFGDMQAYRRDWAIPPEGFNRMVNAVAELGDLSKPVAPMSKFVDESYLNAARPAR